MMCKTRDQYLLLLAHGELPLLRRMLTQAHLRRCASCRGRYRQLENVSQALAGSVRGPMADPWSPTLNKGSAGFASGSRLPRLLLTAFLAFFTVVVLYVVVTFAIAHRQNAAHLPSNPSQGCAPGLPNDQCR